MDFRNDDSRKSIAAHNSNPSYIRAAHHSGDRIQRTDCQTFLVDNCTRADGFDLHNVLVVHRNRHRTQGDTRDSIDRMPHDPGNLRCTDNDHERMKLMDFLAYRPDKCN